VVFSACPFLDKLVSLPLPIALVLQERCKDPEKNLPLGRDVCVVPPRSPTPYDFYYRRGGAAAQCPCSLSQSPVVLRIRLVDFVSPAPPPRRFSPAVVVGVCWWCRTAWHTARDFCPPFPVKNLVSSRELRGQVGSHTYYQ